MKKKIIGLVTVLGLSATLMGCASKGYSDYNKSSVSNQGLNSYRILVDDSLYYIPHDDLKQDLPMKYKKFLEDNPNLKVVGVTDDVVEGRETNRVNGYFIFTEKKGEN
ncbi:hypothetical protein [Bacillus phage vB_BanS-Thrax3]|nr:hypothetical protein [Bacillus phage vB_BanS-Thrax3]